MTEPHHFQLEHKPGAHHPKPGVDYAEAPEFTVSPFQPIDAAGSELATRDVPNCVRLDLEHLDCYEVVDQQFEALGVTFKNAIALQPSNPAFPPRSGKMVLMGAPRNGWVEATFCRPVRFVRGFVTSPRGTVLAAFDSHNQPVAQTKSPTTKSNGSKSNINPHVELSLSGQDIRRITFYTFDGHLTLNDFSFGF
ncbi:MAG TPA: hypothetical protein V6C78_04160 [Crinalium sp.]|jgi:hypothetical protein